LRKVNELEAYIESGILELYVLGDVTPAERQQVEEMMHAHPVVRIEVAAIEAAMEAYAEETAIEPSEALRGKVLNSLLTNLGDDRIFESKKTAPESKVVAMQPRQTNFYKYAFAASVIFLAISVIALFNTRKQLEQSNLQLAVLAAQNQQIASTASFKDRQIATRDSQLKQSQSQLADAVAKNQPVISQPDNFKKQHLVIFKDTSYRLVRLKPVPTAKEQSTNMLVAWSPSKKKVVIDMVASNMPKNDKAHQYQLWALVGGKPVDLGVFDSDGGDTSDMKPMKSIGSADAFAVTLEPRGGSVNPTMSELMVLGK
jgi:anti-sigma-K factor RskA